MNCDNQLCETDLFSFLELHKQDEFFRHCLNYDLQDIGVAFKQRNYSLAASDQVMDYTNPNAPRIKNLGQYLESTKTRVQLRKDIRD